MTSAARARARTWPWMTATSLALLAACCGGPRAASPLQQLDLAPIEPAATPAESESDTDAAAAGTDPSAMESPFAPSALTPLANRIVDLVNAIELDQRLPPGPWRERSFSTLLDDDRPPNTRGQPQTPVIFGARIALYFEEGPGQPAFDNNGVRLDLALFPFGMRVVTLEYRAERERLLKRLPSWLAPIEQVAEELITATREGRTEQYRLQPDEMTRLLPEEMVEELMREVSTPEEDIRAAQRGLNQGAVFLGYEVKELVLLTTNSAGEVFGFQLRIDQDESGGFELREPLIRAQQIWPD